jgi:hypothetical protein
MMFAMNLHIDKLVDNLLILLMLKFQSHRPFGFLSYSRLKLVV